MKKADNFNPGKWLVENKVTTQSRLNENLDVLKKVLNKYLNNDKNTNIEDVGKAFRKLDSKFHNEAFDYIEDKADYLLDDDVFYATAGFPVDTR
jgi:hypothetical protein